MKEKIEILQAEIEQLSISQEGGFRGWWFVRGRLYFDRPSLISQAPTKEDAVDLALRCLELWKEKQNKKKASLRD